MRLGHTHDLQKVFMDMMFAMETIEEMKESLRSEDYGKHLMGVEDFVFLFCFLFFSSFSVLSQEIGWEERL